MITAVSQWSVGEMLGRSIKLISCLTLGMMLTVLVGCQAAPTRSHSPNITIDQAKELILARQVKSIFQPHQGCVLLIMKDGRYLTFEQPHLDWVVSFAADNELLGVIPIALE